MVFDVSVNSLPEIFQVLLL